MSLLHDVSLPECPMPSYNSFTAKQFARYKRRLKAKEGMKTRPQLQITALQYPGPPQNLPTTHDIASARRKYNTFTTGDFERYEKMFNDQIPQNMVSSLELKKPSPIRVDSAKDMDESCRRACDLEKGTPTPTSSQRSSESYGGSISALPLKQKDLPDKCQSRPLRNLRHTFLNVYRRLFSLVFMANMIGFIWVISKYRSSAKLPLSDVATAASANIMAAILIRQDYIINLIFRTCWLVPHSAPLRIRRMLAKVYEYGGVHSGAAFAGVMWFTLLTAAITTKFLQNDLHYGNPILFITYLLLLLFLVILTFTMPFLRTIPRYHNYFEYTHRFLGWLSATLFWAEIILLALSIHNDTKLTLWRALIGLPTFWFLSITTIHIILPWLFLCHWHFTPEVLSKHALRLHFSTPAPRVAVLAIAKHPLGQWHPFAIFPAVTGQKDGGSLLISRAGDWTTDAILDPQTRYWVKGRPRTGVLSMATIFSRVVIVTTGSGIGPCLSFLMDLSKKTQCSLLWSTPSPLQTYGDEVCDMVLRADPGARVIDTRKEGRPDMVALAYEMYVEMGAEAVFIISNQKLTRKFVYGMESRGVPAYGPIWDS